MTESKRHPSGTVIDWPYTSIPEQFCVPGEQFIRIVPGVGCVIEDHTEASRRDDERAGVTYISRGGGANGS
jgi:hypothetical protein